MSWRNINLIFLREVRDQLRDRRTLFMVVVLPLLLYPALGIGMVQMTVLFTEQPRTVVILGTEHLPPQPPLIRGNRFVSDLFEVPQDAETLEVITDAPVDEANASGGRVARPESAKSVDSDKPRPSLRSGRATGTVPERRQKQVLEQARRMRDLLVERRELEAVAGAPAQTQEGRQAEAQDVARRLQRVKDKLRTLLADSRIQVLIVVPGGFCEHIESVNRRIIEQEQQGPSPLPPSRDAGSAGATRLIVVKNSADEKSMIAFNRTNEALRAWEDEILRQRLEEAHLPASLPNPVNPDSVDLAEDAQRSANVWSKVFPLMLVLMAVTGAFYPAVDLAAGEKERGTMETLLICPATRSEIVVGKFLTVMGFSITTAVLNLVSIGITGKYMVSIAGSGPLESISKLAVPGLATLTWVLILLLPLAALFSALCLALATFARSSKEGQYYLTPLLIVTILITVFCLSPGVEITPFYSILPIAGPALLLRTLLASPGTTDGLIYAIPVLITSIGYSLLALWWAIDQFGREDVLFREAERFDLRLWVRHLLRDKESTPSFAEAGFCFVLIMMLQFGALKFFRAPLAQSGTSVPGAVMMRLLLIQQLALIASPALLMGVILTTNALRTFRLRFPQWRMLAAAGLLPFALHPLSLELSSVLQKSFFPQPPPGFAENLAAMTDLRQPLWLVVLTFAVVPAVCEELAFRGFILSGFSRSGRVWLAIGLSSLTFGLMHMIPQQVFNATLMGLVLGLVAMRSGSLFPAILLHGVYNFLAVAHGRVSNLWAHNEPTWVTHSPLSWFVTLQQETLRYQWPTLIIAGAIAMILLRWLVKAVPSADVDGSTATSRIAADSCGVPIRSGPDTSDHPSGGALRGTDATKPPVHVG